MNEHEAFDLIDKIWALLNSQASLTRLETRKAEFLTVYEEQVLARVKQDYQAHLDDVDATIKGLVR